MKVNIAWLTINRGCNLRCSWCYAQGLIENNNSMSFELSKALMDLLFQAGVRKIYFIGGEPTLHPDFFDMLSFAKERGFQSVVVTNGVLLGQSSFCEKILKLQYDSLLFGISFKGMSKEEYISNCKRDCFSQVINGVRNCRLYHFNYSLSYVLSTENIDDLVEFCRNFRKYNKEDGIAFALCNDAILESGEIVKSSDHPLKIERVFTKEYPTIHSILDGRLTLHQIFPLCQCSDNTLNLMQERNQLYTSCHVHARSGVVFDTDGGLLLCNHLAGFSFGRYGKDFSDFPSFERFWDSEYAVSIHKKFTSMPSAKCQTCYQQERCGGGCCTQWFSNTFDSFEKY